MRLQEERSAIFFPGLVLLRVNPCGSSAYLTGWLRPLLWPAGVRVCRHRRDCKHILPEAWLHPGHVQWGVPFGHLVALSWSLPLTLIRFYMMDLFTPYVARALLLPCFGWDLLVCWWTRDKLVWQLGSYNIP